VAFYVKTMLCLANARMGGGRLLLGREFDGERFGEWIRPVSQRDGLTLVTDDRQFVDGVEPRPLDIISIHMRRAAPFGPYREAHLTDPDYFCMRAGRASWARALDAVNRSGRPLWGLGASSAYGLNDLAERRRLNSDGGSVRLVEVSDLQIEGDASADCEAATRGRFIHAGRRYVMPIFDDAIEPMIDQNVGRALICVSLSGTGRSGAFSKRIDSVILPKPAPPAAC
jgi:hypothetical protein